MKIKVHARITLRETIDETLRHALIGPLYLQIGDDHFFPHEGAETLVAIVLGLWINNAMRLLLPDSEVDNITMSSAAAFHACRAVGTDDVSIRLCDSDGRAGGTYVVSYKRYLASLRGSAKSLLNEIAAESLDQHSSVEHLREYVTHIERLEEHIKTHGLP